MQNMSRKHRPHLPVHGQHLSSVPGPLETRRGRKTSFRSAESAALNSSCTNNRTCMHGLHGTWSVYAFLFGFGVCFVYSLMHVLIRLRIQQSPFVLERRELLVDRALDERHQLFDGARVVPIQCQEQSIGLQLPDEEEHADYIDCM